MIGRWLAAADSVLLPVLVLLIAAIVALGLGLFMTGAW